MTSSINAGVNQAFLAGGGGGGGGGGEGGSIPGPWTIYIPCHIQSCPYHRFLHKYKYVQLDTLKKKKKKKCVSGGNGAVSECVCACVRACVRVCVCVCA